MKLFSTTFNHKKPLYIELYESIKDAILSKAISPNEKLPSKRMLARHLSISINTVIKAYELLEDEGYIVSVEKSGYFAHNLNIEVRKSKQIPIIHTKEEFLYDFTTSEIDKTIFPRNELKKLYQKALDSDDFFIRESAKGSINLRTSIAKYMFEVKNVVVNPDDIIVSSGTEVLLDRILKITNSKSAYIENPSYKKFYNVLKNNSIEITLGELDDFGLIPPTNSVDLVLTTPYNQFPTGKKMNLSRKNSFTENKQIKYIVEDSFDSEFKLNPSLSTSMLVLGSNVIYLESFSRVLGSSVRIAFMILPHELTIIHDKIYKAYGSSVSSIDEKVLASFIDKGSYLTYINRVRTLLRKKRELILELIDKDIFEIISKDNYLSIIVKPKKVLDDHFLRENKILISYIEHYEIEHTNYSNNLIIGYSSIPLDKIKDGIHLLNTIFK